MSFENNDSIDLMSANVIGSSPVGGLGVVGGGEVAVLVVVVLVEVEVEVKVEVAVVVG